jgi:hypothetical protein
LLLLLNRALRLSTAGAMSRLFAGQSLTVTAHDEMVDGVACRVAAHVDAPYIIDLQNKNRESIGFLPKMAITERIDKGRCFIGLLHGEPFGYLLFDIGVERVNVLQACIQYDARRRLYGAALYQWGVAKWDTGRVRLKCAADLESNLFWQSMGLVCVGVVDGGKRRGRKINVWNHHLRPELFEPRLITPAFQLREDCKYEDTGFLDEAPKGFEDHGSLGKLAWKRNSA